MKKSFVHYNGAWYSQSPNQPQRDWYDEVLVMLTDENGHVFEVPFRWYKIGGVRPTIRLEVFSGCMEYLEQVEDVTQLANETHYPPTPRAFCEQLEEWGYENDTPYNKSE